MPKKNARSPQVAELRTLLTDYTDFQKPKEIEVDGNRFLVNIPNIGEWAEIQQASAKTRMKDRADGLEFITDTAMRAFLILVHLVRTEDGEAIFTEADESLILRAPVGSPLDKLATAANEALEAEGPDPEAIEKK
jgi:hypothetical protein